MSDKIREAFDAWISSVDKRRDANGWEPLTARDVHMLREGYMEAALAKQAAPAAPVAQEPVAWGAFHFGGKRDGKLYSHADTEPQIDAYILDVHRSSDSVTLRKMPLYAAPPAAEQPDTVKVSRELLERASAILEWDGNPGMTPAQYARNSDSIAAELRALLAEGDKP